jgi:hypothetical protein
MSEIKLPNGVLFNGTLYHTAHLDEITGKQQDYLVNTKYKSPVDHVERILMDLLKDLRDESNNSIFPQVDKLHLITKLMQIEDIQALMIKLREISFGEDFFFDKLECPHCRAKNSARLNLSTLELKLAPVKEAKELVLPKAGVSFEYKPMNLSDLKRIGSSQDQLLNNHVTETMLTILKRIGDKENITANDVQSLKVMDNEFIAKNAPTYSHLDNQITHTCSSCNTDFDFDLGELTSDFFALSRT